MELAQRDGPAELVAQREPGGGRHAAFLVAAAVALAGAVNGLATKPGSGAPTG